MTSSHEHYMKLALDLARRSEGRTRPNPAVGAVVVRHGQVIGSGFHPRAGEPHAEIFALLDAGPATSGADLYVTMEPCVHTGRTGPCTEAILASGIARVFVGCGDPNPLVAGRGIARLEEAGVVVHHGILNSECRQLIAPFAKHVTTGLPFVTLKAASTLDGATATRSGDSQWISGAASRERVHRLRDRVDAIMVGSGTVLRDDPQLTTRLPEGGGRDPLRVIVDSTLKISEAAAVLGNSAPELTLIATTAAAPTDKIRRLETRGVRVLVTEGGPGQLELLPLLQQLGREGIQSLLLEGGGRLNHGMLAAGLVDRVMLFLAPKLLGGEGAGIFTGPGPELLAGAVQLEGMRVSRCGEDILVEGEVLRCSPD